MDVLYVSNDHVIEIQSLRDVDGKAISGAAAQATLYEADGVTPVAGQTWPLPLTYTGARGTYRGELGSGVSVVAGKRYKLVLEAVYVGKMFEATRIVKARVRYE